ncbi:MAG TPA: hypothetical protein PL042_04785 [Caldisericia bacterium]|nr:hypothetical protein [Caldisericia bacterium]
MIICEYYKECTIDYCEHKKPHTREEIMQKSGEDDCRIVPCQNLKDRTGTEKDVFCKEEFIIKVKETIERGGKVL